MSVSDWFRAAVVIIGGGALGSTLTVLVLYFITWFRGGNRMLPLHIWTIALSYIGLLVTFGTALFLRIGEGTPLTGYVLGYGISCLVGIFSMVTIGAKQYLVLTGER